MDKKIFLDQSKFDHKIEYSQRLEPNIYPKTGFMIGSQEYNDYYFPKIDPKTGRHR